MPSETHFFQYAGHWVDYPLRAGGRCGPSLDRQAEGLRRFFERENRAIDPYGPSHMAGRYDRERFESYFGGVHVDGERELFSAYMAALCVSLTGESLPEGARLVEKSVENAEFAGVLRALFPDCCFVHIVRNPYATFVALRKMKETAGYPKVGRLIQSLYASSMSLSKNLLALDRYHVVRFEDLLLRPAEAMGAICASVDLSFREELLRPTLLGETWQGNSTSDRQFSGVSTSPLDRWRGEVTDFEVRLVNRFLAPVMERFGYEIEDPHRYRRGRLAGRQRGERWSVFARNRAFLWACGRR